jgi:putative ABC transport system permease protein
MKLALLELRRRHGRFAVATAALVFLSVLLLFLGALLDGLSIGSSGALKAQKTDLIVYSSSSRDSVLRSRITPELSAIVKATDGVATTSGLGLTLSTAKIPDQKDLADVSVLAYQQGVTGLPDKMAPGTAFADALLKSKGVKQNDTVLVGPKAVPIKVVGFTKNSNFLLQGALWMEENTWRGINNLRPDAIIPAGTVQVLVVNAKPGTNVDELATRIDAATGNRTSTLTKENAILALPGLKQQNATFNGIIGTTFAISALVVALFFALLTLERIPLYGVLKAMGSSTRQLFTGVIAQAIVVTTIAYAIGAGLLLLASKGIPSSVPFLLTPARLVTTAVGLLVSAALGSLLSLKRVLRTDPASAISA